MTFMKKEHRKNGVFPALRGRLGTTAQEKDEIIMNTTEIYSGVALGMSHTITIHGPPHSRL